MKVLCSVSGYCCRAMLGNLNSIVSKMVSVLLLCSLLLAHVRYAASDAGAIESECRDRYFILTLDNTNVKWTRIEAEDATGVHDISEAHAEMCGYTYSPGGREGHVSLRASYLSCHTENQNDQLFTFKFNIISTDAVYHVAKTCSLTLPWSAREVNCEHNYMEVSVQRNAPCTPSGDTSKKAWSSTLSAAHRSEVSGWQVMFLKDGQEVTMSIGEAHAHGYGLGTTANRVVFRSAYRQLHTQNVQVDGITVVMIHATMFHRQKWTVTMTDLSAACTINHGDFDAKTWRLFWEIPAVIIPQVYDRSEFVSKQVGMGVEGQLLDENTWRARGYLLDVRWPVMNLSVPYGAEGGYRRSVVYGNTYIEFYDIDLYYEHLFTEGALETRHRMVRFCQSPPLSQHPFTIDQTVLEESVFTVYLGNFPSDVELVTVKLNAETFSIAEAFQSGYTITEVPHPNGTHAYALKVPFEDPIVLRMYLGEGLLQYSLDIYYTLNILPHGDPYYHLASVVALLKDAFPPDLKGVCTENGVIFEMDHPKRGHLWELTIGDRPLTSELVAERGYIMQNNSQSLTLEVPVFTIGFTYEEITLKQFFGTFEILLRDAKTLDIQKSTKKHCLFNTDELIVCSTDGVMTVVSSLAAAVPPVEPSRTTLLDDSCKPRDADATRALFAFGVTTCGTRVLIGDHYLVYENEIIFHRELAPEGVPIITRDSGFRLTVQCFYQINSTNRLFVDKMFKSETPGFGSIKVKGSASKKYGTPYEPTPTRSVPSHHGAPHVSSNYGVSHISNEVPESGSQSNRYSASQLNSANTVPSTHEGASAQHNPNRVQPALRSYGTFQGNTSKRISDNGGTVEGVDLHLVPGHHGTDKSNETTQRVSNHYMAPQAGSTQHVASSTHSHTSPSGVHQSGGHLNSYSASQLNIANLVPNTPERSRAQHGPNSVQPALRSNGPVQGSTTQRVPVHSEAVVGANIQYVHSHRGAPQAKSTQRTPNHVQSTLCSRGTVDCSSTTEPQVSSSYGGYRLAGSAANTFSATKVVPRHYGAVKGVGTHSVPGHYSDHGGIQGGSLQHDLGDVKSVPVTYGLIRSRGSPPSSVARLHSSRELQFPQEKTSDSGEVQRIAGLSGASTVYPRSHEPSKSECTSKSLNVGPSQFVRVRSDSHRGSRTDVHRRIKTGQDDS